MPVTPFHLGPVIPIRALWPEGLSLGVFGLVQVVMDVEPVWRILAGYPTLHGPVHTLPGSLLVAAVAVVPAKALLSYGYALVRTWGTDAGTLPPWWLAEFNPVTWKSAVVGALGGSVSHVLLDAVIHWDVAPLAPLTRRNPLYLAGSFVWIHVLCAAVGTVGLGMWGVAGRRRSRASAPPTSRAGGALT